MFVLIRVLVSWNEFMVLRELKFFLGLVLNVIGDKKFLFWCLVLRIINCFFICDRFKV